MSLFHSILSQIQQKISHHHTDMGMVAETVSSVLGVPISADQVVLRNTILTLRVQPTIKMALTLKQQALIVALAAKGVKVSTIR